MIILPCLVLSVSVLVAFVTTQACGRRGDGTIASACGGRDVGGVASSSPLGALQCHGLLLSTLLVMTSGSIWLGFRAVGAEGGLEPKLFSCAVAIAGGCFLGSWGRAYWHARWQYLLGDLGLAVFLTLAASLLGVGGASGSSMSVFVIFCAVLSGMAWLTLFRKVREVAPWVALLSVGVLLLRAAVTQQVPEVVIAATFAGCLIGSRSLTGPRRKWMGHMTYSTLGGVLGLLVLCLGNFGEAAMVTLPFLLLLSPAIPGRGWHGHGVRGDEKGGEDNAGEDTRGDLPAAWYSGGELSRGAVRGVAAIFAVHSITVVSAQHLALPWLGWFSLLSTTTLLGITSLGTSRGMRDGIEALLNRLQEMGQIGAAMSVADKRGRSWSEIGLGVVVWFSTAVDGWADGVAKFCGRVLLGSPLDAAEDQLLTYWELAVIRFGAGRVAVVATASSAAVMGCSLGLAALLDTQWVILAVAALMLAVFTVLRGIESGLLGHGLHVARVATWRLLELAPQATPAVEVGREAMLGADSDHWIGALTDGSYGESAANPLDKVPNENHVGSLNRPRVSSEVVCNSVGKMNVDCGSHPWEHYWDHLTAFAETASARRVRLELRERWLEVERARSAHDICLPESNPEVVLQFPIAFIADVQDAGQVVGRVELEVSSEETAVKPVVDELLACLKQINAGAHEGAGQLRFGEVTRVDKSEAVGPAEFAD